MKNNEITTTTIDLTINGDTRTIEARKSIADNGIVSYFIAQESVVVRIGNGMKWHRPVFVEIVEAKNGSLKVANAPVLNKRATTIIWTDQITAEASKSKHFGSKVG